MEEKDPIARFRDYLLKNNLASGEEIAKQEAASEEAVEESVKFALSSPEPTLESAFEDIYAP